MGDLVMKSKDPMQIDLGAPVVPGISAAGIEIGSRIVRLLANETPVWVEPRGSTVFHDFGSVKIWSFEGFIHQVAMGDGYLGRLTNGVGMGATIAEVEAAFGSRVEEDEDDALVLRGVSGFGFETELWGGDHTVEENPSARITQMFVFLADGGRL